MVEVIAGVTALAALIAAVGSVIAIFHVHNLHLQINSRFDEFLATAKALGHAEGKAEGVEDGK